MKDDLYQQAKCGLYWKLENVLRGDAFLLKNNDSATPEEKQARMRVIEEFTKYLRDYDKNMQLLAEYKDFKERIIDDR